jgi:hypothetical protein
MSDTTSNDSDVELRKWVRTLFEIIQRVPESKDELARAGTVSIIAPNVPFLERPRKNVEAKSAEDLERRGKIVDFWESLFSSEISSVERAYTASVAGIPLDIKTLQDTVEVEQSLLQLLNEKLAESREISRETPRAPL